MKSSRKEHKALIARIDGLKDECHDGGKSKFVISAYPDAKGEIGLGVYIHHTWSTI